MCAISKRTIKFIVNPNDEDKKTIYIHDINVKANQYVKLKNRLPKDCFCKVYKPGNRKYACTYSISEILGETGNLVRKDVIIINNIPTIKYTISIVKRHNQTKALINMVVECTKDLIDKRYKPIYFPPIPSSLKLDYDYPEGYVLDGTL